MNGKSKIKFQITRYSSRVTPHPMVTIGITGGYGTGKTTVAREFQRLGARVIDCDRIARRILRTHSDVRNRVLREFGTVNRAKLADKVFSSRRRLRKLNRIIHPAIIKEVTEKLKKLKGRSVVLDAPLLLEVGLDKKVDCLVVVKATPAQQIKRIKKKTNLGVEAIKKRIYHQLPLAEKVRRADLVIDNSKTKTYTKKQVRKIMVSLA